jgi:hypothetical protein
MQMITKKKPNTYYFNTQELLDMIKTLTLRICRVEEEAEIQAKVQET